MLSRLKISNLAIIENIDVSFREGFTVLTGGTGAGKSLVIDSMSLLLGARASTELIRAGEKKAVIEGTFTILNARLKALMVQLDIPEDNDRLYVERVIYPDHSVVKVNGIVISLKDLNKIARLLADIHNQFDVTRILNPENYLSILDGFSYETVRGYKSEYASSLEEYRTAKRDYESLVEQKRKLDENRDFYEYQFSELDAANLEEGIDERIAQEIELLKNYDKIYMLTQQFNEIVDGDFLNQFYEARKLLGTLSSYQPQFNESHEKFQDAYCTVEDEINALKKRFREMDYDPSRMEELTARQADLNALKRKYKKDISGLIGMRDELSELLLKETTIDIDIQNAQKKMASQFEETYRKGYELSEIRRQIARSIEKELEQNLADLLLKARFSVAFNVTDPSMGDIIFKDDGLDVVDFLIETNVGEGLKPLAKIVSGGEASRIMLAFKTLFIKTNRVSTVIFDEIDTGISGEVASAVARKIKEISLMSQVIAITHMPQVASLSNHHILISKSVKEGRTYTAIRELNLEEKIHEVAHLISGNKVTEKQLEYAREMVLSNPGGFESRK